MFRSFWRWSQKDEIVLLLTSLLDQMKIVKLQFSISSCNLSILMSFLCHSVLFSNNYWMASITLLTHILDLLSAHRFCCSDIFPWWIMTMSFCEPSAPNWLTLLAMLFGFTQKRTWILLNTFHLSTKSNVQSVSREQWTPTQSLSVQWGTQGQCLNSNCCLSQAQEGFSSELTFHKTCSKSKNCFSNWKCPSHAQLWEMAVNHQWIQPFADLCLDH